MSIYDDLEETIFHQFNSTTKQSLSDISLDEEEKNKIIFNLSESAKSRLPELRVDFSDFSNHVYFGSAYSAVNFAVKRMLDYPLVGELKDVNQWKDLNSGYENWIFDNWPKSEGYLSFQSSSILPSVGCIDYQNKLNLLSSSFTFEVKVGAVDFDISALNPIFFCFDDDQLFLSYFSNEGTGKEFRVAIVAENTSIFAVDYHPYVSSSRMISFVRESDNSDNALKCYIDGNLVTSSTVYGNFSSSMTMASPSINVGYGRLSGVESSFSGSIDEVRLWTAARSEESIKKNHNRAVYANHSGGLKLYYKFDEVWLTSSSKILDYSGNELHGNFSGGFDPSINFISGNFSPWFYNAGTPILDLKNEDVIELIQLQQESGSIYDAENSNYIFELVPSFLIDSPNSNSDEIKKFLLLLARHWDRLKLYIGHLANIYKTNPTEFNDTPDSLLNLVAKDSGIDLGDIYSSAEPLQYFYGEDVLPSGSLDVSLENISSRLKRNILNNLIYLYKTKSTREAVIAALKTVGLDDSVVNINEYSILSGGIQSNFESKIVERKVLKFDGDTGHQYIQLFSGAYSDIDPKIYQFRLLFNSSSYGNNIVSSSIFRLEDAEGSPFFHAQILREDSNSSRGFLHLYHSSSAGTGTILSSSLFELFNEKWLNINLMRSSSAEVGFRILQLDTNGELAFHFSGNKSSDILYNPSPENVLTKLGSVSGSPFYGFANELRVWNGAVTNSDFYEWQTKDFESLSLNNFLIDIDSKEPDGDNAKLISHLKLNDFTSSATTTGSIHDYYNSRDDSQFYGFSGSSQDIFPGLNIFKLEPSYSYDFTINNDKVRIKEDDRFTKADVTEDVQYFSVDFSPIASLNKEIIKWFGNIDKFSNIIGFPYEKYRDEVSTLNAYREKFFRERVNGSINYSKYFDIVKWFDTNFSYFLSQLIPLEITPSLSNFVVEPNLFEFNKIKNIFPYSDTKESYTISGVISNVSILTASVNGFEISLADPGRFGAALSASGKLSEDTNISYEQNSDDAVNYRNYSYRKLLTNFMSGNVQDGIRSNYFYSYEISCSNYLKNVLNVNTEFNITGVHYVGETGNDSLYLTSSQGAPENLHFSSTIHAVQDSRNLWYNQDNASSKGPSFDFGIGYGGVFGQLWNFSKKSKVGGMNSSDLTSLSFHVGERTKLSNYNVEKYVYVNSGEEKRVQILWPESAEGTVLISSDGGSTGKFEDNSDAVGFGKVINIEGFNSLNVQIIGNAIMGSTLQTPLLVLKFKFQFFEDEFSERGFESILSSSFETSSTITKNITHQYQINLDFGTEGQALDTGQSSFFESFERELPKTKYMRVYVETDVEGSGIGNYYILIKGVFSKEKIFEDILKQRQ